MGRRKRRSDRNHIVYRITCEPTGEEYIGVTVVRGRAFWKSLRLRWLGHLNHALVEKRPYPLHKRIRKYGEEAFTHEILEVVRGKSAAHSLEVELIHEDAPALNVEATSKKKRGTRKRKPA